MKIYRAPDPVVIVNPDTDTPAIFNPSDLLPEDHWAVRHCPDAFENVEDAVRKLYPIESATANPGETRKLPPLPIRR